MTDRSIVRSLATLVLAVSGPMSLFSAIAVLVMIPRGVPAAMVWFLGLALAVSALAVLAHMAVDAGEHRDR